MTTAAPVMGLNGEVALSAANVHVGWANGKRVTMDVRMEWLTRRPFYETVTHSKIVRPLEYASSAAVWKRDRSDITESGRACEILAAVTRVAPGFTHDDLYALRWLDYWHLNAMQAACAHMTHGVRCPFSGYRYGTAWLVRPLPAWFTVAHVSRLLHIAEA